MSIKTCDRCGVTNETAVVIRYPTEKTDAIVHFCDACATETKYTFH